MILKLKKFKITKFQTLSQILNLQIQHYFFLILRFKKCFQNYHQIKNDFLNKGNLKFCMIWTTLNWLHIVWVFLLIFHFFPEYTFVLQNAYGISNLAHFAQMMLTTYLLAEYVWFSLFKKMFFKQNKTTDLMYEYSLKLETELKQTQINYLLHSFNKQYSMIKIYFINVFFWVNIFQLSIVYVFVKFYFVCNIKFWKLLFYLVVSVYPNVQGISFHVFAIVFFTHTFFMITIFKFKLINCEESLKKCLHLKIKSSFDKFCHDFVYLKRSINMYNVFCSKFIFICDLACKLGGSITFSVFYLEKNHQVTKFTLIMSVMYFVSYFGVQFVFTIFAIFPEKKLGYLQNGH